MSFNQYKQTSLAEIRTLSVIPHILAWWLSSFSLSAWKNAQKVVTKGEQTNVYRNETCIKQMLNFIRRRHFNFKTEFLLV